MGFFPRFLNFFQAQDPKSQRSGPLSRAGLLITLLILSCELTLNAFADENWAVLLSGGGDASSNYYRYYNNIKEMHSALRSAGVRRDRIFTLYADGAKSASTIKGPPWYSLSSSTSRVAVPTSLEGDSQKDIQFAANRSDISKVFDQLGGKMKDGDHVVIFVTDHGEDGTGISLWNGESYSVRDFATQLAKLPKGATVHLVTNICYGGQLLALTADNVCVVSNSDAAHMTYSESTNKDPFASGFANSIDKHRWLNGKVSFWSAFQAGKKADHPMNAFHQSSIDYFIANERLAVQPHSSACETLSPIQKLQKDINDWTTYIAEAGDKRRGYYEKYLKDRIAAIEGRLASLRNIYSEFFRSRYQKMLTELKTKWNGLPREEQNRLRPHYTELVEKLNMEDSLQKKRLLDAESEQGGAMAELKFLRYASDAQLERYYKIRRCLEYAI